MGGRECVVLWGMNFILRGMGFIINPVWGLGGGAGA